MPGLIETRLVYMLLSFVGRSSPELVVVRASVRVTRVHGFGIFLFSGVSWIAT